MDLFSQQRVFYIKILVGSLHKIQSKSDKRVETINDHLWKWSCGYNFDVLYPVGCKYAQAVKIYASLCPADTH